MEMYCDREFPPRSFFCVAEVLPWGGTLSLGDNRRNIAGV
jgi:hypothetical protein